MFDPTSRYYNLPVKTISLIDVGETREITYVQRRFIPPADEITVAVEHMVTDGERLDNIAARYIGDPTQFWRICDANGAIRPNELTEKIGRRIIIAVPKF
jgi:hypothetical protein